MISEAVIGYILLLLHTLCTEYFFVFFHVYDISFTTTQLGPKIRSPTGT